MKVLLQSLWERAFFFDWVVLAGVTLLWAVLDATVTPYCREFQFNDPTISFSYVAKESVPVWLLVIVSVVVPCGVVSALTFFTTNQLRRWAEAHIATLTVLEAVTLAQFFTEPMKLFAGRLRPDFLSRLHQFAPTTPTSWEETCTITNSIIVQGRLSFPSGHSSVSFASMTVVALLLLSRSSLRRRGVTSRGHMWRLLLCSAPLVIAYLIALSRTRDHWHHFSDVLAGSAVGVFCGCMAVVLNYTYEERRVVSRHELGEFAADHGGALSSHGDISQAA